MVYKYNPQFQGPARLLASSTMVLSPLCPTSFNVRPSGTPPTQDHMLSPAAQKIRKLKEEVTPAIFGGFDTPPRVTWHDSDDSSDTASVKAQNSLEAAICGFQGYYYSDCSSD